MNFFERKDIKFKCPVCGKTPKMDFLTFPLWRFNPPCSCIMDDNKQIVLETWDHAIRLFLKQKSKDENRYLLQENVARVKELHNDYSGLVCYNNFNGI